MAYADPDYLVQQHWTEEDIPGLKRMCIELGGLYISPTLAKAAAKRGFVEGEHFHIVKPIPISDYQWRFDNCNDPLCVRGQFCSGNSPGCPGRPRATMKVNASVTAEDIHRAMGMLP